MNDRIFISYRRDASAGYARAILQKLTEHFDREQIFIDVDSIEPGLDFLEAIENAVGSCKILLAIIGKNWLSDRLQNSTDYVRIEIAAALDRNVRVVPVFHDGARMPLASDLPGDLVALTRRNGIMVSHEGFDADVGRLIDIVRKDVAPREQKPMVRQEPEVKQEPKPSGAGIPQTPSKIPTHYPVAPKRKRRWSGAFLSLLFFAAVGFGTGDAVFGAYRSKDTAMLAACVVWGLGFLISIKVWAGKKPSR